MTIERSCYCTREQVRRALDVKQAAYNNVQIDRQIQMSGDEVDDLCKRYFYPIDATYKWDWPNFQYTYPWKVYFNQHGLIVLKTLNSGGVIIPNNAVIPRPENDGPPYTWMELRRDMNFSFGNGPTPQQEIQVTGTWGWWLNTRPGGIIASALTDTTGTVVQLNVGSGVYVGVGDTILIDTERMIVTDSSYIDTTISFSGLSTPSPNDNVVGVPDGTKFAVGEVLQADAEWLLIVSIMGNNLVVKRAWDGSVLTSHTGGTLFSNRQVTVVRGALGTVASTHLVNAPVSVFSIPGLVNELSIAYSLIGLTQEVSVYAGGATRSTMSQNSVRTGGQIAEPYPGTGIQGLEQRVAQKYGRVARTRVV
jgi:hypothetical protein